MIHGWEYVLGFYLAACALYGAIQAFWNWREPDSAFWAPWWWVALTWPFWLVVIGLDLKFSVEYPNRRAWLERRRKPD